jgi:hypothetical protein
VKEISVSTFLIKKLVKYYKACVFEAYDNNGKRKVALKRTVADKKIIS